LSEWVRTRRRSRVSVGLINRVLGKVKVCIKGQRV